MKTLVISEILIGAKKNDTLKLSQWYLAEGKVYNI